MLSKDLEQYPVIAKASYTPAKVPYDPFLLLVQATTLSCFACTAIAALSGTFDRRGKIPNG